MSGNGGMGSTGGTDGGGQQATIHRPAPARFRSLPVSPETPSIEISRPARQLALQAAACLLVVSLAWPWFAAREEALPWPETAFAIGGVALLLAVLSRQTWWWRVIHAAFAPLAWAVAQLAIDPGWFLAFFFFLLVVYRGALTGQAPLFLSNSRTAAALAALTADRPGMRLLDLGAGIGSVLVPLARQRPDAHLAGVENSPLVWAIGRLRTATLGNCDWQWGDLHAADLGGYDVVYAFLSPVPMAELWQKVCAEMKPGSLFISNSFAVPGVDASAVAEVDDRRGTHLYCYRR